MATIVEWDGDTLPTINGQMPTVDGEVIVFNAPSGQLSFARWDFTAFHQFTARFYVQMPTTVPSASWSVMNMLAGAGDNNARVNFSGSGAPGQIRYIAAANTQIANSPLNTVAVSTMYRVEVQVDRTAQTYRGMLFSLGSDVALHDTGLLTSIDTGVDGFNNLRLGKLNSSVVNTEFRVGRILLVDTVGAVLGRHASDTLVTAPGPDIIGVWNGIAVEDVEVLGLWNGTGVDEVEVLTTT